MNPKKRREDGRWLKMAAVLTGVCVLTAAAYCQESSQQKRAGLSPVGRALTGGPVFKDVEYVPGGHERQKLDIYLPVERSESPLPLII